MARPVFRFVARLRNPELFTATALLLVAGTALGGLAAGLSMALGAFLAGVLLASSEYRHELEADVAPFKGLLLGLFFLGDRDDRRPARPRRAPGRRRRRWSAASSR